MMKQYLSFKNGFTFLTADEQIPNKVFSRQLQQQTNPSNHYDVAHGSVLSRVKFIKDRISGIWEMLEIVEVCVCACVHACYVSSVTSQWLRSYLYIVARFFWS